MNYIRTAAGFAGALSVVISIAAIIGVVFGVALVATAATFVMMFPLVLLTLPAIKRFERKIKTEVKVKVEAAEAAIAKVKGADDKAGVAL